MTNNIIMYEKYTDLKSLHFCNWASFNKYLILFTDHLILLHIQADTALVAQGLTLSARRPTLKSDFYRRQNLKSIDVRFWCLKTFLALKELQRIERISNEVEKPIKTFMVIPNWKTWSPWFIQNSFSVVKVKEYIYIFYFYSSIVFLLLWHELPGWFPSKHKTFL